MSAVVHHARPLTPDERHAAYADALSFYGLRETYRRALNWAGVFFGALGVACITASVIGWAIVLSRQVPQAQFIFDDPTTGRMNYGVKPADAAALFGPKEATHYLQQYLDVREGYDPHYDRRHFDIVQEMSAPDVFAEYYAWRKSDLSPVKQLGTAGHVKISEADFTPHGKDGDTYEFTVRYRSQQIRDDTVGPVKAFSNVVAFQWRPRTAQSVQEGIDNPGGMVVVSYSVPRPD